MAVLVEDDVSDPVEPVLDSPVPLDPGGNLLGLGIGHGQGADQVDHLNMLPALDSPGASDLDHLRSPGEVGASTALTVRRTRRPWPVSTLETDGTFFQGRALRVRCRLFWLPLTVRR